MHVVVVDKLTMVEFRDPARKIHPAEFGRYEIRNLGL